ncbi:MAG: ATP-binding protein [Dehalococcoidia bacterium]|nr:ATP-binding protein [Dehalococcoidia bacterium]
MKQLKDILGEAVQTPTNISTAATDLGASGIGDEEPEDLCPLCQGARFVRVTSDPNDPRFGRPQPCECARYEEPSDRRARLLRYSRLGPFQRLTFSTLIETGRANDSRLQQQYAEAVRVVRRYAELPEGWLVLVGPHGSGKTHLAAAIANDQIERGKPALFIGVADLLDELRSGYDEDAEVGYDAQLEQVKTAPLLILDDLDAYAQTAWAREKFFQIVSYRFNAALPTVFTAVKPPTEIDERLSSRLVDPAMSQVVELAHGDAAPRYVHIGAMNRERLGRYTFDDFIPDGIGLKGEQRKSLEAAYRDALKWARDPEGWLVFLGGNGCGKTHLAAAIANVRLDQGARVAFATVPDLLDELRATYAPDAPRRYDQLFRSLLDAEVLILDDLGAQKSSPWAEEKLYQLLNHRHVARAYTVVTTNKRLGDIEPRIASRLADKEVSLLREITAPDYRTLKP